MIMPMMTLYDVPSESGKALDQLAALQSAGVSRSPPEICVHEALFVLTEELKSSRTEQRKIIICWLAEELPSDQRPPEALPVIIIHQRPF